MLLPDPSPELPAAPAAFYAALRDRLADLDIVHADAEDDGIDFGDSGIGVTLTHVDDRDWVVGAHVSRRHAVMFVGPAAHHVADLRDPAAIAALVVRALCGEVEVALRYRGDALVGVEAFDHGRSLGAGRVGGPGAWARWRTVREQRRRMDFRRG